jgi:curved DNA-binding protein
MTLALLAVPRPSRAAPGRMISSLQADESPTMKYKDYYATLGVERGAGADEIKKAYRKLARKFHPDVSKEANAEERFKEVAEAYQTLSDVEKRKAYDEIGRRPEGDDFQPPPDWGQRYGERGGGGAAGGSFEDLDLADFFANFSRGGGAAGAGRRRGATGAGAISIPGEDFEVNAAITLEEAFAGTLRELNLGMPEYDAEGRIRRVNRKFKARIPKGATDGQRLRLRGQGGAGFNGGRAGDLYLNIALLPHPLFRPDAHDLFLDLPLAPWEAALGASVAVPTLGGEVSLRIPPGSQSGQKLRLAGRGLPRPGGGAGDLFALVVIVLPPALSDRERELMKELAESSSFDPRAHFKGRVEA